MAIRYIGWLGVVLMVGSLPCQALKQSDFLVKGLEEVEPAFETFNGTMHAGMMPFDMQDPKEGELMFWLFEPDKPTVDDTLVIWLNGGPGCSSFLAGIMFENSPVTIGPLDPGFCCTTGNEPFVPNKYAWTVATNMLYVEQPAGTGFSHGPEPQNEDDLSRDFYKFLRNFYEVFDNFTHHRLFIFGESYAGMYVPSIAREIHLQNIKEGTSFHINLDGIGIGNGLIDVTVQSTAQIDYAYWHGMIDSVTRDAFYAEWDNCYPALHMGEKMGPEVSPFHSFTVPDECGIMGAILMAAGAGQLGPDRAPNTYDVTTWDTYPLLRPQSNVHTFFNDPRVKKALNAPTDIDWLGCMPGQGRRKLLDMEIPEKKLLDDDQPTNMDAYIVELLEADINVLIYNGDRDMACCAQGSEMVLDSLIWSGTEEWKNADRFLWVVDGSSAGYAKRAKNLDFVVVYNSGHMVPTNQPVNALDLLERFLLGKDFSDAKLPHFTDIVSGKAISKANNASGGKKLPGISSHVLVAIICFVVGIFASSWWRKSEYQRLK